MISDSPAEQSFLTDTASLFADLRPGFATFPKTAPILADAFAEGARNLPGSEKLDQRLLSLSQTLEHFGQNPTVQQGLNRLTATAHSLRSPLDVPDPRAVDVQLRDAVPAQHRELAVRAARERLRAALLRRHDR